MDRRAILKKVGYSLASVFTVNALAKNTQLHDSLNNSSSDKKMFTETSTSFSGDVISDSIIVTSRDELIDAQEFIKNVIKKRTQIHMAKNFQPWLAAKTDIDLAYVTLVGHADGTVIDASGIPNIRGNYFLRFFNSGELDVGHLPNLGGMRMSGVLVQGPGRDSEVIGRLFHSPESGLGNIVMGAVTISEFGRGDVYQSNAYNISHFGAQIFRSGVHIDMPSGFVNYGENIAYFGGVIATSSGIGVRNSNPNGEIYVSGVSIDYVGRVFEANAGSIISHGGHHEFNNTSNPLKMVPYFCSQDQSASIVLRDVTIMGFIKDKLPVDAIVESVQGGGGVYFYSCKLLNLLTQSGTFKIGTGIFNAMDSRLLNGGGNFSVSILLSQAENQLSDGEFSTNQDGCDWVMLFDENNDERKLTYYTQLNYYKINKEKNKSLRLTKLSNKGAPLTFVTMVAARRLQNYTYSLKIRTDRSLMGKIFISAYFVSVYYVSDNGQVKFKRKVQHGPVRQVDLTLGINTWRSVVQSPLRMPAPEWASHYMLVINAQGMSEGEIFLSDALITSM